MLRWQVERGGEATGVIVLAASAARALSTARSDRLSLVASERGAGEQRGIPPGPGRSRSWPTGSGREPRSLQTLTTSSAPHSLILTVEELQGQPGRWGRDGEQAAQDDADLAIQIWPRGEVEVVRRNALPGQALVDALRLLPEK